MILKSYVKSCRHGYKYGLVTIWHVGLVFGFGKFWVCSHSAELEQAVKRLQPQVEL